MNMWHLDDFDYELPAELIAQVPASERVGSRLLVVRGDTCTDGQFCDLPDWLKPGDLLVVNDSRVLHARLLGRKDSGGQVEVLIERVLGECDVLAQVRASKSPKPGSRLVLEGALEVAVGEREGEFYRLRFEGDAVGLIERHGRLPLPPYIERNGQTVTEADEARYQTVYAREKGSVAAPTAGLHFDAAMLERLRQHGVEVATLTLHVGAGTFQPVRVENLAEHRMHREAYAVPQATVAAIAAARSRGGRIVAVGTTSARALESAALGGALQAGAGETEIFITPGFRFQLVDMLLTNFHLPKSTLLMLVSAFAGYEEIRAAYRHAVAARYRFFSYGDAMLLHRKADEV
jgi:S-adenosylmethionine:tRNA ribosyltransferase-isomerase